ncbi:MULTISPECIES: DUF1415 domain-containing protein [Niastella]|uniref:DUF1415 domain-containing protein n=1 Tax=Niastella soli TaxID=2821487 RepID=A0ABS3YUD6_9BACT|nr:DUF1415 domain-containing protein [Niastella soli]MBO9201495.1 DUF1415 domain-containing protein [Niastella soli]
MVSDQQIIEQTRNWIKTVVIGLNFCPFANREFKNNTIHYQVEHGTTRSDARNALLKECKRLDANKNIATTLLIFPDYFKEFDTYLQFVSFAEQLMRQKGYEGVYQLATFHPFYQFEGSAPDDAANYTNRSIYPMLHLLREEQVHKAIQFYGNADEIPERNIQFAREKGVPYFKMLRDSCL